MATVGVKGLVNHLAAIQGYWA